ncbi:MAG: hypothetical protein PCFJNLEI_02485 [Verrucomicrobiae bacterium]|nr:hypothetical protein [Verrucomicrobiae bacterium]
MTESLKQPPAVPFAPRRIFPSEYLPVEVAILLSVLLHVAALLLWEYRATLGKFSLFQPVAKLLEAAPRPIAPHPIEPTITFIEQPAPPPPPRQEPRQFVETDATQPTGAEPADAKYYSDRSTVAANPSNPTAKLGDTPYLDGQDTRLTSTESVTPKPAVAAAPPPRPVVAPPAPPRPPAAPLPEPPKPPVAAEGFKVVAEKKVAFLERPAPPPAPPLEVAPVVASPAAGSQREIATLKSKLSASGVSRIGVAAFNVAGSPFGDYDKALIRAVQSRWYALIEKNGLYERAGQVTLKFHLVADGSVQNMSVKENTAGQILGLFCEKAVVDSAPFPPLPESLRQLIGDDAREVNFTFYY